MKDLQPLTVPPWGWELPEDARVRPHELESEKREIDLFRPRAMNVWPRASEWSGEPWVERWPQVRAMVPGLRLARRGAPRWEKAKTWGRPWGWLLPRG